jgi:hypothetical protein
MIKIEDVNVPTKGVAKYFNIIALNFPMNPASVTFYWQILSEVETSMEGETILSPGSSLMDGNLTMSSEVYALWADDDSYVVDWALEELGFIPVTE